MNVVLCAQNCAVTRSNLQRFSHTSTAACVPFFEYSGCAVQQSRFIGCFVAIFRI
ncbi:hypothetical protein LHK_00134 [Laribacter hongkongensis HLHK9]|uniref:Uncharacterized protein n=2 Tax=Laribacter hongkongensis TaxID=168471 RepID=C1DA17_LARHH|nr:hypothetical protein LHK_00134 [Laribacter hongkongensis HLHK9]ASJ22968.1 hypothetical protein LHGZ1_0137 [Laribacter hongkongensis]